MKRIDFSSLRYTAAVCLLVSICHFSFAQDGFSDQTKARLQHIVDSFIQQSSPAYVGGMSVAINVDGLAKWEGAGGYASQGINEQFSPVNSGIDFTTNTISRAYSITKTFTSALVLQLAREGYFRLDEPIGKYFPEMHTYAEQLDTTVTIRQLLNHESGYQDWEDNLELQYAIFTDPTRKWSYYELMHFTEQLTPPGTRREYSHNNYVFLGGIIEKATGQKLENLYSERFFTPLGLYSIYLEGRQGKPETAVMAQPHDNIVGMLNPDFPYKGYTNISFIPFDGITSLSFSGGGLVSNAKDLASWGNALYGGRAVSNSVLNSIVHSISDTADSYGNRLGYGIKMVDKISGKYDFMGHNGSAPGYRSAMFYQPQRKMTIAVLTNYAGVDPYKISAELYKALPQFIGGRNNDQENKIILCYNGKQVEVTRRAAEQLVYDGAKLGSCELEQKLDLRPMAADNFTVYPNPVAGGKLSIAFTPQQPGNALVTINDINGNVVTTVFNGNVDKGIIKQLSLQTGKLQPGSYYCRLQIGNAISEQKFVVVH